MKHREYRPDISGWVIGALEDVGKTIEPILHKAVNEVLQYAFEDDETYIYFPVEWSADPDSTFPGSDGLNGAEVTDPLTVYLCVGLDGGVGATPTYEFNLREALANTMHECASNGSFSTGLKRLSVALRKLADEIDDAVSKGSKTD